MTEDPREGADSHVELPSDPDVSATPLHLRPSSLAWVFAGGVVGTALRYLIEDLLPHDPSGWPWATFLINLAGAFILGALLEGLARLGDDSGWRQRARLCAGTGGCGAFTTYSTLALEGRVARSAWTPRNGDRLWRPQRRRRSRRRVARDRGRGTYSPLAGARMIVVLTLFAGATGALARFLLDSSFKSRWQNQFPWATVIINVTGSLLLGILAGLVLFHGQPSGWQTVVGTGFCGGYTTFSTASFETVRLVQQNRRGLALLNAIGSLVMSVAAAAAGLALAWAS